MVKDVRKVEFEAVKEKPQDNSGPPERIQGNNYNTNRRDDRFNKSCRGHRPRHTTGGHMRHNKYDQKGELQNVDQKWQKFNKQEDNFDGYGQGRQGYNM